MFCSGRSAPGQGGVLLDTPCSADPFLPPLYWVIGYIAFPLASWEGLSQASVKLRCTQACRPAGAVEPGLGPGAFQCLSTAGKSLLGDVSAGVSPGPACPGSAPGKRRSPLSLPMEIMQCNFLLQWQSSGILNPAL